MPVPLEARSRKRVAAVSCMVGAMGDDADRFCSLDVDGAVARLTLNRGEQRNAFSIELLGALHERLDDLERMLGVGGDGLEARPTEARPTGEGESGGEGLRVLVVTGADPCFAAGMDLKQVIIEHSGPELPGRLLHELGRLTLRLRALPLVTVARVNGAAIGGGCGLACACDIAVSHADAKIGYPEVDLGLCPCARSAGA